MTAVVGILNKHAIALAADSAETIGDVYNHKIFNSANKLFSLSKHHPVGVMIYNSATFMGVPWETIIKLYRKELGTNSFPTLREYQENFINFLRQKNSFTTEAEQKTFLLYAVDALLNKTVEQILTDNPLNLHDEADRESFLSLLEQSIDLDTPVLERAPCCDDFQTLSKEEFDLFFETGLNELIQKFRRNGYDITPELEGKISAFVYRVIKAKESISLHTGLIFCGFGENEIYPSLIPVYISLAIENRIRYYIDEGKSATITGSMNGAVCPFAQTDVIDTILSGCDEVINSAYLGQFDKYFRKFQETISGLIGNNNAELKAQIDGIVIHDIVTAYEKEMQKIRREKNINPLMVAVSTLSKTDLAEMAESLIYLTYLKRRITFAEESVGGPVDVAIISKGDGFIWIKRKLYFKPELNQHFFKNYLNI